MPLRILLAVLVALVGTTSPAWATGPQFSSGSGGSGDITDVGDCSGPACFNGTSGNALQFEGSTADGFETTLTATDPTADNTVTIPNFTGTAALERVYDVRAYGAKCDDSTNDTTAIQSAIDAAEAARGGIVMLPANRCIVTALTIDAPGITLRGQGAGVSNKPTVLSCNITTGTCLTFGSSCTSGCGVSDMIISTRAAPTDAVLVDGSSAAGTFARNVNLVSERYCTGFKNIWNLSAINLFYPVAGASCRAVSAVDTRLIMSNVTGSIGTDIEGMVVIEQTGAGQVDTVVMTDVEIAQGGGTGAALKIIGTSAVNPPRWIQISNSLFEAKTTGAAAGDYPIYLSNVRDFKCTNCYAQGGYRGVMITGGPGPITFVNSVIGNTQREGVYHDADVITSLIGTTVSDAGQETDGTYSDVYLTTNSRNFSMIGGRVGAELLGFPGNDPSYGIEVIAGADKYHFSNVNCTDVPDLGCATGLSPATTQAAFTDATAFGDSDWSNYVMVRAPATVASNWTLTLPTTDGNANEILQTDGSGTTAWVAATTFESALEGVMDLQDMQGAVTDSQVPNTITVDLATTATTANAGDSATAFFSSGELERTLLPAASADCAANRFAKGVDADFVLDCAQPAFTDLSGTASAAQITKINAGVGSGGCSYVATANDGTTSCAATLSTPEYVSRIETAGGTLAAYAVVTNNGSNDDEVIEAATTVTQILGCSQSGSSVTSTNPVEVAMAGVARCKADATVTAGSLVKLGATGEFALATMAEKTWGRAVTDDDGLGSAYILLFDGAEGFIDHTLDIGPSIPDLTTNTVNMVNIAPSVDTTGTGGTLNAVRVAPTQTLTGISTNRAFFYQPTITLSGGGDVSSIIGFGMSATVTSAPTTANNGPIINYLAHQSTYTSTTNGKSPMSSGWGNLEAPTISSSGKSGTATVTLHAGVDNNPTFSQTGNGGTLSVTDEIGFRARGTVSASTGGTATVVTRKGFFADDFTKSGVGTPTVTTNIGVDIAALANGGTNIGLRNAATSVFTPTTQAIAAATDTITCSATFRKFTTATGTTVMSSNPTIADGVSGQICILENVDATTTDCITLESDGTKGMWLVSDRTLCTHDTIMLIYDGTDWVELGQANVPGS